MLKNNSLNLFVLLFRRNFNKKIVSDYSVNINWSKQGVIKAYHKTNFLVFHLEYCKVLVFGFSFQFLEVFLCKLKRHVIVWKCYKFHGRFVFDLLISCGLLSIMWFGVLGVLALLGLVHADNKVVCYYNSKSNFRQGQGQFGITFLEPALQFCTHLIYGYAGINEVNFKATPLNEQFDINKNNYRQITDLKRRYPGLRVLLSVGGNEDVSGSGSEKNLKYRTVLESVENRLAFVRSAHDLVKTYGFDGLDLAWEFPETKPKKIHNSFKKFFIGLKHKIVGESVIDDKAAEHKEQFTALVREVKNVFRHDGLMLTLSVLPNVNSSVYFDPRQLAGNLDLIVVHAFDFITPERNPKEADFPAPLYELQDRKYDENGDYQIRFWLTHGAPSNKIILGIPAYGRAWKLDEDSGLSGVPPLSIDDGAADPGPYSNEAGLLSYPEVCAKLANPKQLSVAAGTHLRKVGDPSKRYGTYAYRLPDSDGNNGVWVGYEDPDTAGNKASYAKAKGLGGIAILDITHDDFRGLCTLDKYPILRAARFRL